MLENRNEQKQKLEDLNEFWWNIKGGFCILAQKKKN